MAAPAGIVSFVEAGGHRLEVERIDLGAASRASLVLLHEGLGSVAMWRDFPGKLAHATGCSAIVYSRYGYGRSDPITQPHTVRYMHDEALIVLPELLQRLDIDDPILVGHSDGASIALIHAGARLHEGDPRHARVRAVVAMAPHVMVEDISVRSIEKARHAFLTTDLPQRLARYHVNVESVFRGWNDIWLHADFRAWNIEEYLPTIACPVLAIQGEDDEYGTMEQVRRIAQKVPDAEILALEDCRHSPHRDQTQAVIEAITRFIDRVVAFR
ncbi:MAG TPA: alpha/beta hydrolase [Casimicrobiaceae bacterium]|nr:alpha/beta hydrolase [Casimicrobiaceae bacterium]